jgi:hypothetical protein
MDGGSVFLAGAMQHTFIQKLILVMLAGAIVAGFYVWVYKGIIVGADQAVNGSHRKPGTVSTPAPTPRRF